MADPGASVVSKILDKSDDDDNIINDEDSINSESYSDVTLGDDTHRSEDTDSWAAPEKSSSSSKSSDASTKARSLMECLHRPTASELSRKRKIDCNQPPKGKKRSRGLCSSDPKSITPQHRVKQHPKECFSVSNNKLFCLACREELSVKCSVVNGHIKSAKHSSGKTRLENQKKKDMEIAKALKSHDTLHPKGETLPDSQRIFRVKVARTFLSAGIPLSKVSHFRELLEENGFRLTDRRRMFDVVPLILQQEKERIKNEISGKCLSVIFDGTSRLGEVFVLVIRYVDSDWLVCQRLIKVHMLAKSLSREEIAGRS